MPSSKFRLVLLASILLVLAGTAGASAQEEPVAKIAVLPFEVNADEDLRYLQDSLPELLRDRLAEAGFQVVDADIVTQLMAEQGVATIDVDQARRLAVAAGGTHALYGTFSQLGDALSLEARLVDAFGLEPAVPVFSDKDGLINLLPLVDEVVDQVASVTTQEETIAAIDVEGTRVLDKDVVLIRLALNKGDDYSPKVINEELKNIYDLGYFDDVQVRVSDVTGGKRVVFVVKEKPRIQSIDIRGADYLDRDELVEIVSSKTGAVLNPRVLRRDLATIKAYYKSEGYYKTDVTYEVEGGETGQAKLVFVVEEGEKLFIEKIVFDGVEQLDPDDIKDELALTEKSFFWWIDGTGALNEELLDRDGAAVQAYYANRGFLNVKVARPEVEIREEGIYVTFRVEEGQRYKVGSVDFTGDLIAPEEELKEIVEVDSLVEDNEYLNSETVRTDQEALTEFYTSRGYAYADVGAKFRPNDEEQTVKVVFFLNKHQKVHIRRVFLEGNTNTRDNVILRSVQLGDGDEYNGSKIERSINTLEGLQFFSGVNIEPIPTGDPAEMDLKVAVQEQPTGTIGGGVGYSSAGGVYVGGTIAERNLLGRGYNMTLSGKFGGSASSWDFDFYNPRVNDEYWGWGFGSHLRYDSEPEYDKDSIGFDTRTIHAIGDHTVLANQYNMDFYKIHNVDEDAAESVRDNEGNRVLSSIGSTISRSTVIRSDFYNTDGISTALGMTFGGGPLGGDDNFVKWTLTNNYYTPVLGDLIFHNKSAIGILHDNFGGKDVPLAQRYNLGGPNSVRGYSRGMISPRDDAGDRIGGNKYLVTSAELLYPLDKDYGILGKVFFDAGNSWKEGQMYFEEVDPPNTDSAPAPSLGLYKGVGTGVGWMSPMGPLQLEYGYALDELDDSGTHKIEFMMGQSF